MNTVIRKPASRQQQEFILQLLAGVSFEMDFAADVVEQCDKATEGSLYNEYGSVNLCSVVEDMRNDIEAFTEPQHCNTCNGSGEGMYDGAKCWSCKGKGEFAPLFEIPQCRGTRAQLDGLTVMVAV